MSEDNTTNHISEDLLNNQEFFQFAYDTIRECIKEAYRLQAREEFVEIEKAKLHKSIVEAKSFEEEKPQYLNYLQNLQTALYQQNLQVFQQLLTYFIKDVLHSEKEISMSLSVHRSMPALDIEVINEGFKESIIDGSGGAVANIISTGLRLICLSRLAHRKFIILDEPDCWIKPEFVPAFARIIGELSRKLRIQTVIISHHEWSVFKDYGRVIELDKDGAILQTRIAHDTVFNEEDTQFDYIKKVSLRRFMSHYNTTYELHPFLTCIIGKNDLGKSVIGSAIKALAFNLSKDSSIKHNEKSAQVYIETSVGDGFLWERFLEKEKGQEQKIKYTLFKDEQIIASEFNAKKTPDFINEKLKIMKTEGIDVHISNQKTPIFMIDDNTSQQDRAKILSLGKELIIIQKMMEHIKRKALDYSRQNKKDEILYAQYVKELKLLNGIGDKITELEELQKRIDDLKKSIESDDFLNKFLPEFKHLRDLSNIQKIAQNLTMPVFEDESVLNEILWELDIGRKYAEINPLTSLPPIPSFQNEDEINNLIHNLHYLIKADNIEHIEPLKIPEFEDNNELKRIINNLKSVQLLSQMKQIEPLVMPVIEDEDLINSLLFDLDSDLNEIEQLNEKIKHANEVKQNIDLERQNLDIRIAEYHKSVGNFCPTCKQKVSFEIYKEHIL